jgi:hypothetical protein
LASTTWLNGRLLASMPGSAGVLSAWLVLLDALGD